MAQPSAKVGGYDVVTSSVVIARPGQSINVYPFWEENNDLRIEFQIYADDEIDRIRVRRRNIPHTIVEFRRTKVFDMPRGNMSEFSIALDSEFEYFMNFTVEFFGRDGRYGVKLSYIVYRTPLEIAAGAEDAG